ncbi:copper amine oxidase N-terminal domain-containing protein [Paenibacillus sp. FSL R5-0527]|uniref:copper amine oxidase N-terminal domain-containing protein n=1 Tax=Paenibacillus sp. FSL R5-0527 TaxID=2975321 RepID=UPI00097A5A3C|nr:N-acetylmuramoyl-L-alanine amidase [Paenibacillus macerans]
MKRSKVMVLMLSFVMVFGLAVSTASAAKINVIVQVDGKTVKFPDEKPYFESNRVLIPIRFVSEALGAKVNYKKEKTGNRVERVVYVELEGKTIRMPVNSDSVLVGDVFVKLEVPARMQGSRVLIPLRFVSEALGATVDWNQSKKLVSISTGAEVIEPEPDPNNMYNTDFEWGTDSSGYMYNKLAKELFANNMKVSNGKLTFTLPKGAKASYGGEKLTPGKTYTYEIGRGKGSITFAQVYPGRESQEGYFVILDSKDDEDLSLLFGDITDDAIVVEAGSYSGAPLKDVQKLAQQLK